MWRSIAVGAVLVVAGCATPRTDLSCPDTLRPGETGQLVGSFQQNPDYVTWTILDGQGMVAGHTDDRYRTALVTPARGPRLVVEMRATWLRFRQFHPDGDVGYRTGTARQCRIEVPVPDPSTTPPPPTGADPSGADITLYDDVAGDANWTSNVSSERGGATYEPGNPMVHRLPGTADVNAPTFITVEHRFRGGGWDAAVDGPLSHLVHTVTRQQVDPPFDRAAIGDAFAIWQGGERFVHFLDEGGQFANTAPETTTTGALTPADFEPAPGPDFGAAGAPMTFGFVRSNTNQSSDAIVTQHTATDWTVELYASR